MAETKEIRAIYCGELRADSEADGPVIEGYAAVFDKWSEDLGGFREIIREGAFSRSLKSKPDVRALVDHDPSRILGRTKSGTLELREDKKGLWSRVKLPDTQSGRDIFTSVKRGDVSQMSFAFQVRGSDGASWNDDFSERELLDLDLFDVSPVTFPAYPDTVVAARHRICGRKLKLAEKMRSRIKMLTTG